MFILCVQTLLFCTLCSVLWRLLRNSILKSPLHDLPGPQRFSVISGNLLQVFSPNGIPWHLAMAKRYGRVFKFHGFLGDEQIYVTDARALHHIVVKDQYIYEETSMFIEGNKLLFGESLLSTLGDHHKKQRKMLNPVFSIAHMRNLMPAFYGIAHRVRDVLAKKVKDGPQEINMLYWFSLMALESIGQAGLGHSLENVENETPTSPYAQAIRDMPPAFFGLAICRQFLPYLVRLGPAWFREFVLQFIPSTNLQKVKKIVDLMHQMAIDVLKAKKQALDEGDEALANQIGEGKDIMSVLLKANATADEADRLPEKAILGQMNSLVMAGHDTTSNALSRILHLLTLNPEVQTKLRQEITEARTGGDLPYDELMALPYLDAVIRESLRLYPPVTFVSRTTRKDVILPLGTPVKSADGKRDIHEIFLKNNTNVVIGIAAVNRDPAIWFDEAEVWKPERWIDHNLDDVVKERLPGVYAGMMTFLGGGRACIGFKFSELEMKVVLSVLLEALVFEPSNSDIVWRNNGIATPAAKGKETETPHLPLMVSLAKSISA